jgi:hypothetical protein
MVSYTEPRRVLPPGSARTAGAILRISVASVLSTCLFVHRADATPSFPSCTVREARVVGWLRSLTHGDARQE